MPAQTPAAPGSVGLMLGEEKKQRRMARPSRGYAARIQPPLTPGDYVERPRLRDLLDAAVPKGLALLVAPGGFGKTVALSDFARQASFPVAWLTVTAADGDLASFVEAVVAAVRRVAPGLGAAALRAARQPGEQAVEAVADELVAELTARGAPIGLVLDDFHAVDVSREPSRLLAHVMDRAPSNLALAIGSRTLPALPHARLLAAGRMAGITADDLRFSEDEVGRYLGVSRDSELARTLFGRTSGWPAALHLAGGTVSHAAIDEYLESEVFAAQRPAVREFMLAASVPTVLTEQLCRDVLDEPRGPDYLAEAHTQGLFVAALPAGGWRIHDLFRDFLRARLRRGDPGRWEILHARVAEVLPAAEAVPLLLEAGLHDEAAETLQAHADRLIEGGRWGSLRSWLEALPARSRSRWPRLLTLHARVLSFDASPGDILSLVDDAVIACAAMGDRIGEAEALAYRATRLGASGRLAEAGEDVVRVRQLLGGRDVRAAATIARIEGLLAMRRGDLGAARAAFSDALQRAHRHRDRVEQGHAERGLAVAANARGDLGAANAHNERAIRLLEDVGETRLAAEARVGVGFTQRRQGTPQLARDSFEEALTRSERGGFRRVRAYALDNLAALDREAGNINSALARFTTTLELAREIDDAELIAACLDHLAQCHRMVAGQAAAAEALARQALAEADRVGSTALAARARATLSGALLDQGILAESLAMAGDVLSAPAGARSDSVDVRTRLVAGLASRELVRADWAEHIREAAKVAGSMRDRAFLRAEVSTMGARLRELVGDRDVGGEVRAILDAADSAAISSPVPTMPRESTDLLAVTVRLLGRPEILVDGAPPPDRGGHWRLAATRELFYLLEANRQGLTPDQIVDRLWPDAAPGRGQQLFWHYSHRLRGVLAPSALLKRESRWLLNPAMQIDTDVERFQAAVDRMRAAATGSDAESSAIAEARALYAGPYLDGLMSPWLLPQRDGLEAMNREVMQRNAELLLEAGEASAAARLAQRLLRLEPRSEQACRLVLRALRASGQSVNARQVYHRFSRRIEQQVGSPPAHSIREFLESPPNVTLAERHA